MNVVHSSPGNPMRAMTLLATTPVGEKGERLPARAPLPIMIAMRKNEMPVRAATAIAGGASSAAAPMLPGPIVDKPSARKKNMIGSTPVCPRQSRTARSVTRSSVPLPRAMLKSRVTPASVTNSGVGNPSRMSPTDMPPRSTPTIHANARQTMPTLIVVTMLSVTAMINAPTEIQARSISYVGRPALQHHRLPFEHAGSHRVHHVADVAHLLE